MIDTLLIVGVIICIFGAGVAVVLSAESDHPGRWGAVGGSLFVAAMVMVGIGMSREAQACEDRGGIRDSRGDCLVIPQESP